MRYSDVYCRKRTKLEKIGNLSVEKFCTVKYFLQVVTYQQLYAWWKRKRMYFSAKSVISWLVWMCINDASPQRSNYHVLTIARPTCAPQL